MQFKDQLLFSPPSPSVGVRWTEKKSKSWQIFNNKKIGPNLSNWFSLAKFCKVRQGEVARLFERLHDLHMPGSHQKSLTTALTLCVTEGRTMIRLAFDRNQRCKTVWLRLFLNLNGAWILMIRITWFACQQNTMLWWSHFLKGCFQRGFFFTCQAVTQNIQMYQT